GEWTNGAVDMTAVGLRRGVAIEQRRKNLCRQGRGREQRVAVERLQDQRAELARERILIRKLLVVLHAARQVPGRAAPVFPARLLELLPYVRQRVGGEHVRNLDQHRILCRGDRRPALATRGPNVFVLGQRN